ncbi:hypothetical protein ABPG77_007104 [Micractinium sp. CCAP 211/92]
MGISGLHPLLKPYLAQSHARDFGGCRLGVDAWAWLHRGAVGAARELATGKRPWEARGFDAPWVTFCLKMVAMLQAAGATPVLVFDGCRLPAKAGTNAQRRQRREEARARGMELLQEGREAEAGAAFAQGIHVTPEMAHELIVQLRVRGVEFVVAPYEADAQLAFLASIPEAEGGVSAVVTEDSDLVGYGCRRVLFKMDSGGSCWELSLDQLVAGPQAAINAASATQGSGGGSSENGGGNVGTAASSAGGGKGSGKGSRKGSSRGGGSTLSFQGWTHDMLQAACVLAGCDFLPSLKGVSFRTAAGFVARGRSLEGALKAMQAEKRFRTAVTEEYRKGAAQALAAFRHALVFCHNTAGGRLRRLTPLPHAPSGQGTQGQQEQGQQQQREQGPALAGADLAHLGAELDAEVARGLAYGYLHPHTLQPFADSGGAERSSRATQQCQPQQQRPSRPGHEPPPPPPQQQLLPSMAGRRQLGSWMMGAAHSAGLGPIQRHPHLQRRGHHNHHSRQHSQRGQQGQHRGHQHRAPALLPQQPRQLDAANSMGVPRLYQPSQQHAAPPAGQHQMPPPSAGVVAPGQRNPFARLQLEALAGAEGAGAGFLSSLPHAVPAAAGVLEPQGSGLEAADTQASATAAMETSRPRQAQQQQQQQLSPGAKRKGSSGGGSGSGGKKGPRQLAPPSQRISRFFAPTSRLQ